MERGVRKTQQGDKIPVGGGHRYIFVALAKSGP